MGRFSEPLISAIFRVGEGAVGLMLRRLTDGFQTPISLKRFRGGCMPIRKDIPLISRRNAFSS